MITPVAALAGLLVLVAGSDAVEVIPAQVTHTRPQVGQVERWFADVAVAAGRRVRLVTPPAADPSLVWLERRVTPEAEGILRVEVAWTATTPGAHRIEAAALSVLDAAGHEVHRITTTPVELEVRSTVGDDETPVLAPLIERPGDGEGSRWWWGAVVGLFLATWIGWLRWRGSTALAATPVAMTAEEALRRFALLLQEGSTRASDRLPDRLGDILRAYLETRYRVPAPCRASEEILAALSRHELEGPVRELQQLLEELDRHKFAAVPLGHVEFEGCVRRARYFVQATASRDMASEATP